MVDAASLGDTTAAGAAEAQIREQEAVRARALVSADTVALRDVFDERLIVTHSHGVRDTAADLLDAISTGRTRYERFDLQIGEIIARDDHAVAIGDLHAAILTPDGASHPIRALSTTVWTRQGDGPWRLLAAQTTSATPLTSAR